MLRLSLPAADLRYVNAEVARDFSEGLAIQYVVTHGVQAMCVDLILTPALTRFGIRLGFRLRLVALEALLEDVGCRPRQALRDAYTTKWLEKALGEMVMAECGG